MLAAVFPATLGNTSTVESEGYTLHNISLIIHFQMSFQKKLAIEFHVLYITSIRRSKKMSKTKLTLYVDKEVSERAKKISRITGKSVSNIVTDFINKQDLKINDFKISEKVSKWAGFAKSDKDYKELRDEVVEDKVKKYEDTH